MSGSEQNTGRTRGLTEAQEAIKDWYDSLRSYDWVSPDIFLTHEFGVLVKPAAGDHFSEELAQGVLLLVECVVGDGPAIRISVADGIQPHDLRKTGAKVVLTTEQRNSFKECVRVNDFDDVGGKGLEAALAQVTDLRGEVAHAPALR